MAETAILTTEVAVTVTVEQLAQLFCDMDDDAQARFFCECARLAAKWPVGGHGAGWQWFEIGKHLATCDCATEEGREMIRAIHSAMALDWKSELAERAAIRERDAREEAELAKWL